MTNERYVGDLLMRKYYTPPMLPLRAKKNRGEEDMFLCEGAHEAIIPKEDYLAVQEMRRERSEKYFKPPQENFDVYDDRSVRLLIEYIRVMEDGKIVIMLKGGITIEERVE